MSKDPSIMEDFIQRCIHNLNETSLQTLQYAINVAEQNVDKFSLGITVNKFISEDEFLSISIVGAVNIKLQIPKNLYLILLQWYISLYLKKD